MPPAVGLTGPGLSPSIGGGTFVAGKDGATTMSQRLRQTVIIAAARVLTVFAAGAANAGTTLYNGIVLPDQWPPRIDKLTPEPMPVPYLKNPPAVISIDVGRQLFVDDFLIAETTLQRTFHAATYDPRNPLVQPDRPWEQTGESPCAMVFSDGVWFDPKDNLYKMWYMGGYVGATCYATSRDGFRWDKPALDVVPGTNIVYSTKRDSSTVWLDLAEKDPTRRYKLVMFPSPSDSYAVTVHFSPDGIHWSEPVVRSGPCGDRTTVFWNPFRSVWVCGIRGSAGLAGADARVRLYHEGADLVAAATWKAGEPVLWCGADALDPQRPDLNTPPQLYNLDAVAYESIMLGLFSIWRGQPKDRPKPNDIVLGYSRDGFHWHRSTRSPFLPVSERRGDWNWGNVQSAGGCCLVVGDELRFYVSGRAGVSGSSASGTCATGLATLRRDGFASMDAGEKEGSLTTRPLTFAGRYLFVNADARGGELRVEVLDRDGKPMEPYGRRVCQPMTIDSTIYPVQWMHARDVGALAGKPVLLRFHLTKAKLYSFWISPDETGASRGYVAAGGPGYTGPRDTVGLAAYDAAAAIAKSTNSQTTASAPSERIWTCVTPHAPFTPRDTAEDFVFRGRMWLSNGWRSSATRKPEEELTRDLWCSSDGRRWTRVSDATPYDPYSEMVVFQDKVWAIKASVWNSTDGEHWVRVLDKTPFGARGYGEAVVFKDRIWQLGSGCDVWCSPDGVNWTCAVDKAPFGTRMGSAVAAFDGRLWLMAGNTPGANTPVEKGYKDVTTHNDVWSSADGTNWTRVLEHAPWPPRQWCVAAVYAGRLWLIGGYYNVSHMNLGDVWTTTNGRDWQSFESPVRFAPRHEVTPYVFNGSLWVVGGNTWPVVNDVWRLTLPDSPLLPGER